ncbi:unnamed protein product [Didymodactylos carnosus]|uniref:LamG-like jellyroll fold domain-containing protein n=1 Tax=Didymodactylos carnosus TaxID=1234261 RepID=A0A814EJM2_9BILA|nr:unnamed protein product [Didymodactylos carnosus]CAF3741523.1 unnamed protein product [Didymodactylos carnosus]
MAAMEAIGVLCDRRDIYDEAINYFYKGGGNGAMHKAVYYIHSGNLGQWQESGRDQGHNTLGIALMGPICEMAWNQGDDLYGYWNSRFLAGAEYVAKFNLGFGVPYQPYMWGVGQNGQWSIQPQISEAHRGHTRPVWELVYGHYTDRMGMAAPYTAQFVARVRPEGGASPSNPSSFDQFGFGTLTFTRDPVATPTKPSSLMAAKRADKVVLSWWGAAGATSYNVKRSTKVGGPYITIGVSDNFTYTDTDLAPGKYYYVVTGLVESYTNETAPSNEAEVSTAPELYIYLKFDETSGMTAADATGSGHIGTFVNGATFVAGKSGNAISLDGRNSYVSLSEDVVFDLTDFTISAWVYLNDNTRQWPRIFDFGGKTGTYMFLTPKGPKGTLRFTVATVYTYNEQVIDATAVFPTRQWVHIAVTLSDRVGTIYVNGVAVGSNPTIDFPPFQLGATPNNWIGRSQFDNDPYLNSTVDDFRIYKGSLSANDVAALAKE